MKPERVRIKWAPLLVALALLLVVPTVQAGPDKGYRAFAEFRANPSGCRETYALVTVTQMETHNPPGPRVPEITVELIYHVRSTCADPGDFLFYYEFHTMGPVTIPASDFSIHSGLNRATLNTTLPVYDEEAGIAFDLDVEVLWTATGKAGPQARLADAVLEVSAPFPLQYADSNPVSGPLAAELRKLR